MIEEPQRKYEFKLQLEELKAKIGKGTELISLYIPPDKQISDVVAQLRDEHSQASNIKSKSTRVNVQSALDSIMARLKYYQRPPKNGLVIFTGAIPASGDRTSIETFIIEPPEPIKTYMYRCGSEFVLEPLEEMLKEKKTYGLIVLDRREATIGILKGKHIEVNRYLTSNVPGKQKKGGQSAHRFQQLRLIAIDEFYKRIGSHASNIFLNTPELEGILIGGPSPTKEEFIKGEYLHHELRKKILGSFDVSYTDESGLYELVDAARETLEGLDLMREKKVMERFMKELVSDKGLAAYGEEEVRKNLEGGAVEVLLLSEDLRKTRLKMQCRNCGYEKNITVIRRPGINEKTISENCTKCSSPLIVVDSEDIVLELSKLAEKMGTKVEFISTDFEEGAQLLHAFGGIAAILRYKTEV
jgi:peptide chain release factor subunit 1